MGNPFQNESSDLLSLDTKNIANPSLAQLVAIHHQRGLKQVEVFLGGLHKEEGMSEITANRDSSSTLSSGISLVALLCIFSNIYTSFLRCGFHACIQYSK